MIHKIEDRQKYNRLILKKLSDLIEKHPDIRFGQLLTITKVNEEHQSISNIGDVYLPTLKDKFNEEPEITYKRIITK